MNDKPIGPVRKRIDAVLNDENMQLLYIKRAIGADVAHALGPEFVASNLPAQGRRMVAERTSKFEQHNASGLFELNPWSQVEWANCLRQALEDHCACEGLLIIHIVSAEWLRDSLLRINRRVFSCDEARDRTLAVYGELERTALLQVRSRMRGLDFLLQSEIAIKRETTLVGRVGHFAFHYHGLAWGDPEVIKSRFENASNGLGDLPPVVVKPIYDIDVALGYITKDDRLASNLFRTAPRHDRDPGANPRSDLPTKNERLALLRCLEHRTKPSLCAAGGLGAQVLARAKQIARANGWPGGDRRGSRACLTGTARLQSSPTPSLGEPPLRATTRLRADVNQAPRARIPSARANHQQSKSRADRPRWP
jgi:hypothetical protein